jgi:hypothetical protein
MSWSFQARSQKLLKANINLVTSVRPSVHMEQLGSHWTDFDETWYLGSFFENMLRKRTFHSNPSRITGTLHEDVSTFMTASRQILLIMRNGLEKICTENKNTHFMFSNFFPKIAPFMR